MSNLAALQSRMPLTALQAGNDLLDRAEALAVAAGNPAAGQWSVETDILRSAWLFTGTAVDTYFHERVRRALTVRPLSKVTSQYGIPLGAVDEMIAAFIDNRAKSRPRVKLANILHEALLRETFQGSRNIETAFAMIGVKSCWSKLATVLSETSTEVQGRVNKQYARRNRIAHEGDYMRQQRPRHLWYEKIDRAEVDAEVLWTRGFLNAADSL